MQPLLSAKKANLSICAAKYAKDKDLWRRGRMPCKHSRIYSPLPWHRSTHLGGPQHRNHGCGLLDECRIFLGSDRRVTGDRIGYDLQSVWVPKNRRWLLQRLRRRRQETSQSSSLHYWFVTRRWRVRALNDRQEERHGLYKRIPRSRGERPARQRTELLLEKTFRQHMRRL